jgi:hypothetical protein
VALVEMIGELGGTFGHGVTYDANLHTTLRRRYRSGCGQDERAGAGGAGPADRGGAER